MVDRQVVFVLSNLSFPPREGLHIQSTALMRMLRQRGVPVGVITLVRNPRALDADALAQWAGGLAFLEVIPTQLNYPLLLARNLVFGWRPSALTRVIAARLKAWPDATVHLEGIGLAPLLPMCAAHGTVMSTVDAWSLRQSRLAEGTTGLKRALLKMYAGLSVMAERKYFPMAGAVHAVSAADAAYLRHVIPQSRIEAIPVALIDPPAPGVSEHRGNRAEPVVLFWGDISVSHLRAGLEWLFDTVAPRLAGQGVRVRWVVLGRREPNGALRSKAADAHFVGWVDDVGAELRKASVVVLPDKSGTGLKNRALHAMACGVPVLGSSYAFEGIPVTDGVEALVRDSVEDFVAGLADLLQSPQLAVALGERGRAFVLDGYGLDAVVDNWERLYRTLPRPQQVEPS